tara:strand:- start:8238 stop:8396 length:159 start_codon:yes stop_codon:yes gene_type:complete
MTKNTADMNKKIDEMNWIFESIRESLEKIREGRGGDIKTNKNTDEKKVLDIS